MSLAPIVLFVYNRPEHTKKTIEALQNNELSEDSELFIYSDAAKSIVDDEKVREVRKYVKSVTGFKKVSIIERDINFGLARSIIDGVTEIVNKYGKIIVLEDDILTSTFFLRFMNQALDLYEKEEKVMHISGYFFPVNTNNIPETFFYNQTSCWGWATWSRAWKNFNKDVDYLLNKIKDTKLKAKKEWYYKNMLSQLKANKFGRINTWGAKWQASVILNDGLCLHPRNSFVQNIGNDGSGIHCSVSNLYDINKLSGYLEVKKIDLDESLEVKKIMNFFYKKNNLNFFKKIYKILFK